MEETASRCNVSHASSPALPICPQSSYLLLSPCTVDTTLNAIRDDIDMVTLQGICEGLLKTIKTHETVHCQVEDQLSEQIKGLRDQVVEYQKTYNQAPKGYIENTCFPNLKVPTGAGFYLPAKWIKRCDDGDIACFTAQDGPKDPLHIVPIYTLPTTTDNTLSRPLL
jgi:hypothetical protein